MKFSMRLRDKKQDSSSLIEKNYSDEAGLNDTERNKERAIFL